MTENTMTEFDTQIDDLKTLMQSDTVPPNPVYSRRLSADAKPFTPSYESGILTPVPSVSTNSPIVEPTFQTETEHDVEKTPIEAVLSEETDGEGSLITDSELLSMLFLLSLVAVALRIASISPDYRHIRSTVLYLMQSAFQGAIYLQTTPLLRPFQAYVCS